jgi:arylsulfatase A-like enzyme
MVFRNCQAKIFNIEEFIMTNYVDRKTFRGPYRKAGPAAGPDILMMSFDMVPREFYLPREGDLAPHTPNLESLKKDGLFFSNTYAVSPLCAPSRAALYTGRYSYIVANGERCHDGQQEHIREGDTIYPEYLRASGYRTRHFGKCHIGAAKYLDAFGENDAPWDRWSPPWYDDDGYREYLRSLGIESFQFEREIRGLSPSGRGKGNFLGGWVSAAGGRPFPKEGTYPAYITNLVLSELKNRKPGQPSYLQIDYFEPHQPFFIPSGYEEREKELRAALSLPEFREPAACGRPGAPLPLIYSRYRSYWGIGDRKIAEDYLVANVMQYEILDEQIGRIIRRLKEADVYDKTMIILTADHGEMNCRDGLVDKGAYLNPRVLQVPLYLKPAAPTPAVPARGGTVIDRLCSLLDIAPTILGAAGIDALTRFDGRSLFEEGPGDRKLLAEVFAHVLPNPAACLIMERGEETGMYTVNFTDTVDEWYRRGKGGIWTEQNGAIPGAGLYDIIKEMIAFFDADERWSAYSSYMRVIHAGAEESGRDLQKFVSHSTFVS